MTEEELFVLELAGRRLVKEEAVQVLGVGELVDAKCRVVKDGGEVEDEAACKHEEDEEVALVEDPITGHDVDGDEDADGLEYDGELELELVEFWDEGPVEVVEANVEQEANVEESEFDVVEGLGGLK